MTLSLTEKEKLYIFDTLHDFGDGIRTNKTNADNTQFNKETKQKLNTAVTSFLNKFLRISSKLSINNIISSLTYNRVNSVESSKYETAINTYYETISQLKHELYADTKQFYSYETIINAWTKWEKNKQNKPIPDLWDDLNSSADYVKIIEINNDTKDKIYTSFGKVNSNNKQKIIGNFILNFMFPKFNLNNPPNNAYFTFDASPGIIKTIFTNFNNVYNLITPANITDSAPTSYDIFIQNRNEYYFPSQTKTNKYTFNSNFYSKADIQLSLLNTGYSNLNRYGFSLQIYINKSKYLINLPFSASQTTGPSVNYLINLCVKNNTSKFETTKMLNLSKLKQTNQLQPHINELLFDIKRTGDYEQVNSAIEAVKSGNYPFTIVSTIDKLCALYSRINQQNTIINYQDKLTLYRFPVNVNITDETKLLHSLKKKCSVLIDSLKLLKGFMNKQIYQEIATFNQKIIHFLHYGKFKDTNSKNASVNIENIVTIIIKFRLIDILFSLNKVKNNNPSISISNINKLIEQLTEFVVKPEIKNANKIEELIKNYDKISVNADLTAITLLFNLKSNFIYFEDNLNDFLGINYNFYDNNNNFNITGNCKSLHFSNRLYSIIYEYLNKFEKLLTSKSVRNNTSLNDKLKKFTYFTEIDNLFTSFFDSDPRTVNIYKNKNTKLGYIVTNLLRPDTDEDDDAANDEVVKEWFNNLEKSLLTAYQTIYKTENIAQYNNIQQDLPSSAISPANNSPEVSEYTWWENPSQDNTQYNNIQQGLPSPAISPAISPTISPAISPTISPTISPAISPTISPTNNSPEVSEYTWWENPSPDNTQTGGNQSNTMQYQYLSDLLRSIAGIAAAYIESIISTKYHHQLPDLNTFIFDLNTHHLLDCQNLLKEIQFIWISEIMTIQANIENNYNYTPTSSEYIILLLLCFYSNTDKNTIDIEMMQMFDLYYNQYNSFNSKPNPNKGGSKTTTRYKLKSNKTRTVKKPIQSKYTSSNVSNSNNQPTIVSSRNISYTKTQINDIGLLYITLSSHTNNIIPAEIITILLFTLLDNTMQISQNNPNYGKKGYFYNLISSNSIPSNFFDNKYTWNDLPRYIYTYVYFITTNVFNNSAFKLLRGGTIDT
jgi:hypothetical protein